MRAAYFCLLFIASVLSQIYNVEWSRRCLMWSLPLRGHKYNTGSNALHGYAAYCLYVYLCPEEKGTKCTQLLLCTLHTFSLAYLNSSVSSVVKHMLSVQEVWGWIPGQVKLDTMSPTARHRYDVSS